MSGMERKHRLRRLVPVLCCVGVVCIVSTAWAVPDYLADFEKTYPAAKYSRIDSCLLCHTSTPAHNIYGAVYGNAGHNFKAIEAGDSDGDGFTNIAEINAFSFPGSASDRPVGMVVVSIEPQGARDAGAQWRLGADGAFHEAGVLLTGVAVGLQTVQFAPVAGWVTPVDQQVTVVANQTAYATGMYTRLQVTVPGVIGETLAAATADLAAAGLAVGTVTREYSDSAPAGQVLGQTPTAGTVVDSGLAVALTVSKGPPPITVPNVVNLARTDAETAIVAAGLVVGVVTQRHDATVPEGAVVSQTPSAGMETSPGSAVGLLVSLGPGPVTVPSVTGQTQAAAAASLSNAGLAVGSVTQEHSSSVPVGRVVSQVPGANLPADAGSAVDLVLSLGPEPLPAPDVTGLTQDAAEAAIAAAGFGVGQVNESASDTVTAGTVISQSPAAGTLLVPSSLINLTVSSGPPSAGCACVALQKGDLVPDGLAGIFGDLFVMVFGLATLKTLARPRL